MYTQKYIYDMYSELEDKFFVFELEDGTKIKLKNNEKTYRIGMHIDGEINRVETFYSLTPREIKKHTKIYNGTLIYIVDMFT